MSEPKKKSGRPPRGKGPAEVRVPLLLTEEEDKAFDEVSKKAFPGASKGFILRLLIAGLCKEHKVRWPEDQR